MSPYDDGWLLDDPCDRTVTKVSDPPTLSTADIDRIQQESRRLYDAFTARTARMEIFTSEDLRTLVK